MTLRVEYGTFVDWSKLAVEMLEMLGYTFKRTTSLWSHPSGGCRPVTVDELRTPEKARALYNFLVKEAYGGV